MDWVGWLVVWLLLAVLTMFLTKTYLFRGSVVGADIFDGVICRYIIIGSLLAWPLVLILLLVSLSSNARK